MTVSIKQHFTHAPSQESIEFKRVLGACQADLAAIRAAFVALTAKIDADSGDTGGDSDYAATVDPAALNLIP